MEEVDFSRSGTGLDDIYQKGLGARESDSRVPSPFDSLSLVHLRCPRISESSLPPSMRGLSYYPSGVAVIFLNRINIKNFQVTGNSGMRNGGM